MEGSMKITQRRRLLLQGLIVVEMILLTASAFRWGLCTTRTTITTTADNDDSYDNSKWCPSFLVQQQRQVVEVLLKQTLETFQDGDTGAKTTTGQKRLQRYRLKLVLQLEDRTQLSPLQQQQEQHRERTLYHHWSGGWNEWMEQTSFSKWPFWKESPTSTVILGGELTNMSITKQQHENVETRLVSTSLVEELFQSYLYRLDDDDELEVILYVYTQQQQQQQQSQSHVLLFKDDNTGKESEALVVHQNRLIILQGRNTSTIGDSMSYLIPFLSANTLSLAHHDHDGGGSVLNNSTSIAAWQQRVAKSYVQKLHSELLSTRDWLVQFSTTNVHIPARIGEQWMQAFTSYSQAIQLHQQQSEIAAEQGQQWRDVLELLEQAQLELSQLRADPALMPPLHFQVDHTLAIFAPLLFPLLMPMMVGLRREYKRYKTGSFP